jgi:zinc/manganese transport system ATP-binding protein
VRVELPGTAGRARAASAQSLPTPSAAVLSVDEVSASLSGRRVLEEVSFEIEEGQFTGLIGSNGAGKTTLIRAILGLIPYSGSVLVAGRPRSRRNPLIGYVPQRLNLDPEMPLRARDLVGLGLDGHRLGFPRRSSQRAAFVEEMLEAVDAAHFADARVGLLSGGEQQRVMIAHALVSRPRLLLLDEPLANLDLRSEDEVVSLLARVANQQQVAVLISAHDMNPLLDHMHRVVYMADGRVMSGTPAEVVTSETLSELYRHRVHVLHVEGRVLVVTGRGPTPNRHPDLNRRPE